MSSPYKVYRDADYIQECAKQSMANVALEVKDCIFFPRGQWVITDACHDSTNAYYTTVPC